jgi:hypothetical protein
MLSAYRYKARLEKLIRQWTEYRGLVLTRMGSGDVKPTEERNFLTLKGQIAEALAVLTGRLNQATAQDANTHLRAMNSLLNRYPTLYADSSLKGKEREEFEREWHDHFLFFNKLKGMQDQAESPDERSRTITTSQVAGEGLHGTTGGTRMSVLLLRIGLLVVIGLALVRFVPWNLMAGGYQKTGCGGGVGGFFAGVWASIKNTFANMSTGGVGVLEPVASQYGAEVTLILVAVLLIGLGYFIFVRMR